VTPSRQEVEAEISEQELDLAAFREARDLIRKRVVVSTDTPRLLMPLHQWSGSDAVLGSLDLVIHSLERTIHELVVMRDHSDLLTVPTEPPPKKPHLTLVKGNDDEHQG
jgi:hypothetical protein